MTVAVRANDMLISHLSLADYCMFIYHIFIFCFVLVHLQPCVPLSSVSFASGSFSIHY